MLSTLILFTATFQNVFHLLHIVVDKTFLLKFNTPITPEQIKRYINIFLDFFHLKVGNFHRGRKQRERPLS